MQLALVYAFEELNMFRASILVPEYDFAAGEACQAAGFQVEVRQREILYRDGRYWDLLHFGLLCEDWLAGREVHREQ